MRKVALILVCVSLAVVMFGCGGTAEQTSGSSYNYNSSSYK